jgi:hypothetical protein
MQMLKHLTGGIFQCFEAQEQDEGEGRNLYG